MTHNEKRLKIILSVFLAVAIIAVGGFAGVKIYTAGKDARIERMVEKIESTVYPVTVDFDSLERQEFSAAYAFDVFNLNKATTFVDHVFVGKVDEIVGTTYPKVFYKGDGTVAAVPETHYKATVIKVIKGDLAVGESVSLTKHGGVNYDNASLTIASGDSMPRTGQYYIFSGNDNADGVYICDPVGNRIIEEATVQNAAALDTALEEYVEAEKHPDPEVAALKAKMDTAKSEATE